MSGSYRAAKKTKPTKPRDQNRQTEEAPLQRTPALFHRWIAQSSGTLKQDDISSDADKSTQLLLQTTAPLQTQGGREGKQECRPKALQSLEQEYSTPHSDTLGQLSHVHMLSNMQLQQRNAYNAPAKPTLHTTHSRIPLRAQQVFTPRDPTVQQRKRSPQNPGTKTGKPKRHPCRGLPLFSIGGSHRAQEL